MESYNVLKEIQKEYLTDFSDEKAIKILNENINKISDALIEDFKTLTNDKLIVDNVTIYFDDKNFKQCATAYFITGKFSSDTQFCLSIECLVDFDKIGVKSKTEPNEPSFINFNKSIIINSNVEGYTELNKLFN
jgi:hypothetical protein